MNESSLRVNMRRLRQSYRAILLRHVRATVESDEETKDEASYLMQLFS
jgi:hypothetical protein